MDSGHRPGREEVVVSDEVTRSVMVLEFVFRCEDITVWFGARTLAVIERGVFAAWLWRGGALLVDDLLWSVEGGTTFLTIDARHTYVVDGETVRRLATAVA
ncbi:hypothetical protein [Kineosporia sp. NBRC 101731]|uniref:hypothetical protein n=1 Tax=Kineosporia sp. NBRC 101731 TaxID=3032199 RepID=UPI0024A3B07D|nr:hypothetical protein [Kineosporia sp. NBRC 101731]GLY29555.1 hypothetical protein Kisp02_29200 [Kineosporia sp. NBRC 101731]